MKSKLPLWLSVIALSLLVVGCGDDDDNQAANDGAAKNTQQTAPSSAPSEETGAPGKTPKVSGKLGEKPEIATPVGDPPTKLVTDDIKKGKGKRAKGGDNLTMQYVGISWSTGEQFDASWDNGQPFEFPLGFGRVIDGWDQGIEGMRAGGRRILVIPPALGYGAQGSPPSIAPNETLVFVVDLEKIE